MLAVTAEHAGWFVNNGKVVDQSMLQFFDREAVPLLQATPGAGTLGAGHAEAAAAGLRQDPAGQQKILGGSMQDVNNAVSSVSMCSVARSDDMNTFLNVKDEVHKNDWGVDKGHAISQEIMKEIRGAYGGAGLESGETSAFDNLLRWSIREGSIPDGREEARHEGAAGAIGAGAEEEE